MAREDMYMSNECGGWYIQCQHNWELIGINKWECFKCEANKEIVANKKIVYRYPKNYPAANKIYLVKRLRKNINKEFKEYLTKEVRKNDIIKLTHHEETKEHDA